MSSKARLAAAMAACALSVLTALVAYVPLPVTPVTWSDLSARESLAIVGGNPHCFQTKNVTCPDVQTDCYNAGECDPDTHACSTQSAVYKSLTQYTVVEGHKTTGKDDFDDHSLPQIYCTFMAFCKAQCDPVAGEWHCNGDEPLPWFGWGDWRQPAFATGNDCP